MDNFDILVYVKTYLYCKVQRFMWRLDCIRRYFTRICEYALAEVCYHDALKLKSEDKLIEAYRMTKKVTDHWGKAVQQMKETYFLIECERAKKTQG